MHIFYIIEHTSFFDKFAGLGLREGGHLIRLEVGARVLKAVEMNILAVYDKVWKLLW